MEKTNIDWNSVGVVALGVFLYGFKVFTYNQNLKQTDTIQASSQQLLTDVLEKVIRYQSNKNKLRILILLIG